MHITYSLLFEMPLIWNAKGLLHGQFDVWNDIYLAYFKQLEWGVYFINTKQNMSTGKQGISSHWLMGGVTASLNV